MTNETKDRPLLDTLTRTQAYDVSYFGFCPECRKPPTGGGNVHSTHLQWCDDCRTWWTFGANLFSNWRHETEGEWEENWRKLTDGGYREVEPVGGWEIPLTLWERFLEWRQERWAHRHEEES